MRYWAGGAISAFIALVQTSSVEQFHVLGVVPNLLLVLLVAWLVVRGLDDVLPMVGVAGLTIGLIGLQTPGLALLAMLFAMLAAGAVRELHIIHSELVLIALLTLGASLIYESALLASVMVAAGVAGAGDGLTQAVLPAALVNLAITPPVYLLLRVLAAPARRGIAYA